MAISNPLHRLAVLTGTAVLTAALIVLGATLALASHVKQDEFGTSGTGNAQFNTSAGVAVNQDTNAVYVVDNGNDRVQVFDQDGNYQSEFGSSQLSRPEGVAVDQDTGEIYVTDSQAYKVFKFAADGTYTGTSWGGPGTGDGKFADLTQGDNIAVDPDGNVWVTDEGAYPRWAQKFDSDGNHLLTVNDVFGLGGNGAVAVAAHPTADAIYIATKTSFMYSLTFSRSGDFVGLVSFGVPHTALGVDPASELLYAYDPSGPEIVLYDTATEPIQQPAELERFGSGEGWATGSATRNALAFSADAGATGSLYATDGANDRVMIFFVTPRPPSPPDVGGESSFERGDEARLRGEVNPVNSEITSCEFQWGTAVGTYPNSAPCEPDLTGKGGQRAFEVSAQITGLDEQTEYHWRIVAENGQGRTEGTDQMFTTSNLPEVTIDPPTDITAHSATLSGTINPEGIRRTRYQFEVSEDGFATTIDFPSSPSNVGGTDPVPIEETATGLKANADYEVRLHVTSRNGDRDSATLAFSTPAVPPVVKHGLPTAGKESAILRAWVNPENAETTYFFEWGTDTSYGNRIPVPDGTVNGFQFATISEQLTGLERNTTYHYRITAENKAGQVVGPDQAVTTTDTGLINNRAYELVSPADKGGQTVNGYGSAARSGEAFIFHSAGSFGDEADGTRLVNSYYAERTADGWNTTNITPFMGKDGALGANGVEMYDRFTPDLSHGFYADFAGPDGLTSVPGLRDAFARTLPDGGYSLLTPTPAEVTSAKDRYAPTVSAYSADRQTVFIQAKRNASFSLCCDAGPGPYQVNVGSGEVRPVHVLPEHRQQIELTSPLNPRQDDGGEFTLIFDGEETAPLDWLASAGDVQSALEGLGNVEPGEVRVTGGPSPSWNPRRLGPYQVTFLGDHLNADVPELGADGSALTGGTTIEAGHKRFPSNQASLGNGGQGPLYMPRAVSADGTRAIWSGDNGLFLRDTGTASPRTIELGVATDGSAVAGGTFYTADRELEEIFFESGAALTADALSGGSLYRFDVASGELTNLTPRDEPGGNAISAFVRASTDASHVYFAARQQLTPDAERGQNIYLWRDDGTAGGTLEHVAQLETTGTRADGQILAPSEGGPTDVTPDGRFLIFKSVNNLTGYDNVGNCSRQVGEWPPQNGPCRQIYIFDAEAPEGEQLRCVSCHPDGIPPQTQHEPWMDRDELNQHELGGAGSVQDAPKTEPNYISDDGEHVFFETHEALVSRDTNGYADVYEYDVPSGQLSLVTTGKTAPGSPGAGLFTPDHVLDGFRLLDSSGDGDVFFATYKSLVPRDDNTTADVYVARIGGGLPQPEPERDCQGSECQGDPEPAPDEEAIGSSTATGEGNLDPEAQRCQRLVAWFQDLKTRFLRLKVAYFQADTAAERQRIKRRALRVKRKAIQVRQAAIECRENL